MKQSALKKITFLAALLAVLAGAQASAQDAQVKASFLYTLSTFKGTLPVSWVKLEIDEAQNEVYVLAYPDVKIFNENGMEVYSFNEGGELGIISDLAVQPSGDMIVLSTIEMKSCLMRCNFRGERLASMELKNLPAEFTGFTPDRMVRHGDSFYFASQNMKLIVTDSNGVFRKGYDIAALMEKDLSEKEKTDLGINGFSVDGKDNILFTNSAMGRVFRMSSDGSIAAFGTRGSSPGKFGVPAGVTVDATGNYMLVADTLRCVVMIFDSRFRFLTEFGFSGNNPGNLRGPLFIAVDKANRLYVSQLGNRGVNVYQISVS